METPLAPGCPEWMSGSADERQPRPTGSRRDASCRPPRCRTSGGTRSGFAALVPRPRPVHARQGRRDRRRRTTASWRSPWRCATGSPSAGWRRSGPTTSRTSKRAYYLSAEFLLGRALGNNLINTGPARRRARGAARARASTSTSCSSRSRTPGLGNGGLGRLAACFLDSMATLGLPGHGLRHPLRVRHLRRRTSSTATRSSAPTSGCVRQPLGDRPARSTRSRCASTAASSTHRTRDGRPRGALGGRQDGPRRALRHADRRLRQRHREHAAAVAGARAARSSTSQLFNAGDYVRAVEEKNDSEIISKVLYPNDNFQAGKELRLKQEYFFVACSIADIVRRYLKTHTRLRATSPTRSPSSSTTRTRPSPSPS